MEHLTFSKENVVTTNFLLQIGNFGILSTSTQNLHVQ